MNIHHLIRKEINLSDLSEEESELFYKNLFEVYPDTFADIDEKDFEENIIKIVHPIKLKRLEMNKKIFYEFRRICNEQYPDTPFGDYLLKERKLPSKKVMVFKLFFVINYFEVNNHLKKKFSLKDLQRSGLYSQKEDGSGNLIFFNHRLIIPYLHNGEIIYLRGRYFDKENKTNPAPGNSKYMGLSNDTLNLNATKRFYNTEVLRSMLDGERLLIVEGELDAIAGEAIGINTMGIPGSQNIPPLEQFKKLLKYQITLCGDNDSAGSDMLKKVGDVLLSLKKEYTIKQLTTKDLNEFLAA